MGANEDVDLSGFGFFEDDLFLFSGAEARDHLDIDREVGEPFFKGFIVLEAEHGCRA